VVRPYYPRWGGHTLFTYNFFRAQRTGFSHRVGAPTGHRCGAPALRFAPVLCCRAVLMYTKTTRGLSVHKKHNTPRNATT
jgi:hypothetical protein